MPQAVSPYKSNLKDDEVLSREERAEKCVREFMDLSRRYTRTYFDKFSKLFEEYLTARAARKNPLQKANLRPPYAFTIVETYLPHIIEAFLADKPYLTISGRRPEDMQFEELLEEFISYQMDEMGFFDRFAVFLKDYLLFGTAVAKVSWNYKTRKVPQTKMIPNADTGEQTPVQLETVEVVKDLPDFDPISIFDFFPDPTSSRPGDVQSMRGCVHRVWRTFDEIKSKEKHTLSDGSVTGVYTNLGKLKESLEPSSEPGMSSDAREDHTRRDMALGIENGLKRENKIELEEYWGLFDYFGNGKLVECVLTRANQKVIIRAELTPLEAQFKPFVVGVNYPVPGEFYGLGEIEPVWSLLKEATALRNARLDTANQAVNRMWIIDRASGINVRNLYSRAGGIILANDINGIKPLDPPEVVGSAFREVSELDYGIQQAVALPNPSANVGKVAPGFSRTAAGVNYLQGMTSSRLSLKIRMLSQRVMNEFGRMLLMLNRQFMTEQVWIRVMNQDSPNPFQALPPDAFSSQYDFSANSAMDRLTRKDRQASLQQNILPLLQAAEQFRPGLVKWELFFPDTLRDFDYRNTDKYLSTPEEQQQFQQAQAQAAQEQATQNAQTQAQSQAQLIQLKGQMDSQQKSANNESALTRDVVKGLMKMMESMAGHDMKGQNEMKKTLAQFIGKSNE